MNYPETVFNILTSTFFVGIATYVLQKYIDKRLGALEEFKKTLLAVKKEQYDSYKKNHQEIWEKIVEIEYYLRHDLNRQLKEALEKSDNKLSLNASPIQNIFPFVEKKSIFISETLNKKIKKLLNIYFVKAFNDYNETLKKATANQASIEDLESVIPSVLGDQYRKDLNEIRNEFENMSNTILFNKEKNNV